MECVIYPSTCDSDLGEVLLPEPKPVSVDSNPFGYIHYIPSSSDDSEHNGNLVMESEDLITLVLPTQGVEDSLAVAGDEEVVSYHEEDMAALQLMVRLKCEEEAGWVWQCTVCERRHADKTRIRKHIKKCHV